MYDYVNMCRYVYITYRCLGACYMDTVRYIYIATTALSFSFNLSKNPASNCTLFVNESMVK